MTHLKVMYLTAIWLIKASEEAELVSRKRVSPGNLSWPSVRKPNRDSSRCLNKLG